MRKMRITRWLQTLVRKRAKPGKQPVQRLNWTPELVERFWTGFSQTRLTEYSFARQGGKSLIVAIEHRLPKGGRILDYGAGSGELVELLLDRCYNVAAYEPSGGRSSQLAERLDERHGFLGTVGPDSAETFDVVLMVEVIEHILDQQLDSVLRRINRLIKDNGTLIVTTPNDEDLELGMTYCPVSNLLFHRWQHVRSFTAQSLTELLSRYGIEPLVVHQTDFRVDLYLPYDQMWGGEQFDSNLPSHLVAMRTDIPVRIGSENNLLFIGRKTSRM